jgi:hypothetical protein
LKITDWEDYNDEEKVNWRHLMKQLICEKVNPRKLLRHPFFASLQGKPKKVAGTQSYNNNNLIV